MEVPPRDKVCEEQSGRELIYLDIDELVNTETQPVQIE